MKKIIILSVLVNFAIVNIKANDGSYSKLTEKLVSNINKCGEKSASISFYAIKLKDKEELASINPYQTLVPASIMKLFTTASALEIFGEKFTFETSIYHDGEISKEGVLHGNIYIKGGGDPSLGSKLFFEEYYKSYFLQNWVEAIKKLGIKKIEGNIIGDSTIYGTELVPMTWCWEDIGNYYGTGYSGLSIYDNQFEIELKENDINKVGIFAITPDIPHEIVIKNELFKRTDKTKNKINIFRGSYQNVIYLRGYIGKKNKKNIIVKGAIPDPTVWASYTLYKKLLENSIEINGIYTKTNKKAIPYKNMKKVCSTISPTMNKILDAINKESINQYAEQVLAHIGCKFRDHGNTKSGLKYLAEFWKKNGIDTEFCHFCDGSGLSRYNAVNAKSIVQLILYMLKTKHKKTFLSSFSVCGKDGTLKEKFTSNLLCDNLIGKTGSMTRVRNLAGIIKNSKGEKIVFALLINNYICKSSEIDEAMQSFLVGIYKNEPVK